MSTGSHTATFYVQIEPQFWRWTTDDPQVSALHAVRMTQKRPRVQRPGTAMVKLTVRINDAAFLPLRPEAIIEIPMDLVTIEPLRVEAGDPT